MQRKPQQQTLSIRVSDALREFLERSKQVISSGRGEMVSTSDVAKILLESAKDDRLDFRLEVAELQQSATQSLWVIRRKWEQNNDRSRAEWMFMAQYIQVACEDVSEVYALPSAASFATLVEAWLSIRGLREDRGALLDRYYLGNLGSEDGAALNERQIDPDLVSRVGERLIRELRESASAKKPAFAGRNFYVAIRDEELPDVVAVNRVLLPFMPVLFRLAARGHWQRERQPVRLLRETELIAGASHHTSAPGFRIDFQTSSTGELTVVLSLLDKDLMYPVSPYPQICEFFAMVENLSPDAEWRGVHFAGRTVRTEEGVRFYFHARKDGIDLGFSQEEWATIKRLISEALATPWLKQALAELSLTYGEL